LATACGATPPAPPQSSSPGPTAKPPRFWPWTPPSGLDLTTGAAGTPAIRATATLTLALPKVGLLDAPDVGELYLADISVPPLVYQRMGIAVPELFRQSSLLRIGPPALSARPAR
jgi:hypothetical protein